MKLFKIALIMTAVECVAVVPSMAVPTIYVDQNATYRYINATSATEQGSPGSSWFAFGFNDSSWSTGMGTFSNTTPTATILDQGNVGLPFGGSAQPLPAGFTQWDVNFAPFLRTDFTLSAPTNLTIWIAIDNGIGTHASDPRNGTGADTGMYINGVHSTNIGLVNAEGNAFRWENVFNIPAAYTFAGKNVFALQLEDHGGLTGFDMMITSQVGNDNPLFTTAPPPPPPTPGVPEPLTLALFGAGLAGSIAIRRRRNR
jgi:hypothetical protein